MFSFLRAAPQPPVIMEVPSVRIVVDHQLKTVFLYTDDSRVTDEAYSPLEAHYNKQGYFLQVIVAPEGFPSDRMRA